MSWVGEYLAEKRPDVIIQIGDFADMPSLSSYDAGKKCYEGRTYKADIASSIEAMELLLAPIERYNRSRRKRGLRPYKPRMILTLGNHEFRINRAIEVERKLDGTISTDDFKFKKFG